MAIRYNYDIASTQRFVESAINDEFDSFMESRFGSLSESSIGYKTVDIADTDGIDITDTIKGNFDNWEGIVPDDTIGDITAEFDSFLESRFPSVDKYDLINEGMFRDNRISNASAGDYGEIDVDTRDIEAMRDCLVEIKDNIYAIEYLKHGYKTGKTKRTNKKLYLSPDKTRYDEEQLDRRLKWLRSNYKRIEAAYEKAGGDQTYYMALAAQALADKNLTNKRGN